MKAATPKRRGLAALNTLLIIALMAVVAMAAYGLNSSRFQAELKRLVAVQLGPVDAGTPHNP